MLRLGLALLALLRAIGAALKGKPKSEPVEHLPDGHPDAAPPYRRKQPKYHNSPIDPDTGTWRK